MIDFTKPVQTLDGRPVRILCTDRKGSRPVVGLVPSNEGSTEILHSYRADGVHSACRSYNLVNVPERTSQFMNVYDDLGVRLGSPHSSMDVAKKVSRNLPRAFKGVMEIVFIDDIPVEMKFHPNSG